MKQYVLEDNKKQLRDGLATDRVDLVEPVEFYKAKTRTKGCEQFMEIIKNTILTEEEFLIRRL